MQRLRGMLDGFLQQVEAASRPRMAKRNSELLNSLLGLPKNILKSGRR